jgi:hypothetical protein
LVFCPKINDECILGKCMAYIPKKESCMMRENCDSLVRIAVALERILTTRYGR